MKKISIIITTLSLTILAACTSSTNKIKVDQIAEPVNKELAEDSLEILSLLEEKVQATNKPDYTEKEAQAILDYQYKYNDQAKEYIGVIPKETQPAFTTSDDAIYGTTTLLIAYFGPDAKVDQDGQFLPKPEIMQQHKEEIIESIENAHPEDQ